MAEMIKKIITTQVEVTGKDRVLEFVGSTELPDRDNEIIKASAWQVEQYTKNPVVQWAHNYAEPPIGKTLSIRQSQGKTIFEIEFADKDTYEFADTIYKLCKGGFLNATSVGFIPLEWDAGKKDSDPNRIYTKVELLEISIVPVPANPDALISARNAGVVSLKEYDLAKKVFSVVLKPEETENFFRIPVAGEGDKHGDHRIRTIDISAEKGIKALYCGECKVVMTYLFSKEERYGWTMEKAQAWVKEHAKDVQPLSVSQKELKDELDFALSILKTVGVSEEVKDTAIAVKDEIVRLTGGVTPVDIKSPIRGMIEPVLKVLSDHHEAHNKCNKACRKMLEGLIESEPPEDVEEDKQINPKEIIEQTIKTEIENWRKIHGND